MRLLGNLLASALSSLGVTHLPTTLRAEPVWRGPTPARQRKRKFSFAAGVQNAAARRRREALDAKRGHTRGAVTIVGQNSPVYAAGRLVGWRPGRRVWTAGLSSLHPDSCTGGEK